MTDQNPFKKLSSKEVYRNKWICVTEDQVERPDGKPGIFDVVTMCPGASIVVLDSQKRVYLAREFKYGVGRETIELVSGGIDANETPLECAQRELREEIGVVAHNWTQLGTVDPFTTVIRSPNHMFLAEDLEMVTADSDEGEVVAPLLVPLEEAIKMVESGEITHGASCVALLLVARRFGM